MARTVVIDEIHITLRVPADLADDRTEVIRQTVASDEFFARLRRAVRDILRTYPASSPLPVSLTR